VRWDISAKEPLLWHLEDFLASPPGRRQYSITVRKEYSSPGAAVHHAEEKENYYLAQEDSGEDLGRQPVISLESAEGMMLRCQSKGRDRYDVPGLA
jgi:hypothetical protein